MPSTVLIVDDHAGYRAQARALLDAEGFRVVGEAEDAASALVEAAALQPDIVLLDVRLPDEDGFTVAGRLSQAQPDVVVVLISSRDATAYRRRLAATTARGFIPKAELTGSTLAALVR